PILLTALIGVALLPTLLFGFVLWQGAVELPWPGFMTDFAGPSAPAPEVVEASAASSTALETVLPKHDIQRPDVALSIPGSIDAQAGKESPFAITLDSDQALPPRTIITVSGLAEGTVFSAGRPYGETEWTLLPDEIGDLAMTPPLNA